MSVGTQKVQFFAPCYEPSTFYFYEWCMFDDKRFMKYELNPIKLLQGNQCKYI